MSDFYNTSALGYAMIKAGQPHGCDISTNKKESYHDNL